MPRGWMHNEDVRFYSCFTSTYQVLWRGHHSVQCKGTYRAQYKPPPVVDTLSALALVVKQRKIYHGRGILE